MPICNDLNYGFNKREIIDSMTEEEEKKKKKKTVEVEENGKENEEEEADDITRKLHVKTSRCIFDFSLKNSTKF